MKTRLLSILTLAVSIALVIPAQAITVSVNTNDPFCDDAFGTPFCSIGAGLDAALPGDIITVAAGVYSEGLFIDKDNLALIGQGRPVIDGGGVNIRVHISASGVTVSDFDLTNGATILILCAPRCGSNFITRNRVFGGRSIGGGIGIISDRNVISHNLVTENIQSGIVVGGSDNVFIKNVVTRNSGPGFITANSLASHNRFTKNKAIRNGVAGFLIISGFNVFNRNMAIRNQHGFFDNTGGAGTRGTANRYKKNICKKNRIAGSVPDRLCKPQRL